MSDVTVLHGDMRTVLGGMCAAGETVQAIVTDPPYHLTTGKRGGTGEASLNEASPAGRARISTGFMGKTWDGGDIAFRPGTWRLCWELLPPGGHLVAFSGTRTYHRMATAIEEAGFEIRDQLQWLYGSGFPKSLDVSKAIDRAAGVEREVVTEGAPVKRMIPGADQHRNGWEKNNGRVYVPTETAAATDAARQWEGWGTALKPACEPICLARKPFSGTVAANVLAHGAGALNIDACRVPAEVGFEEYVLKTARPNSAGLQHNGVVMNRPLAPTVNTSPLGRWPANVVHDGSAEVLAGFPSSKSTGGQASLGAFRGGAVYGKGRDEREKRDAGMGDQGSAARFFYTAKADAGDRLGSKHPTVKPVALMRWLVRLITPPGGTVLDPFAGSGTTGMACLAEGFDCILVEREAEYVADIRRRIAHVQGGDTPLFAP